MRSYNPNYKPNLGQLRRAADLILAARRPLLIIGGGVIGANAGEELTWLARNLHIPVAGTFMGLGGFPGDDPLWLGMLGMHGAVPANRAVVNTDLIIACGTRFADRVTGKVSAFAPNAKIIHIDIDPTSIRKNIQVDVPIVADCKQTLSALRDMFNARNGGHDWLAGHHDWVESLNAIVQDSKNACDGGPCEDIKPQEVIRMLDRLSGGQAVVTTDVGQHQMWTGLCFTFTRPRTLLSSGGLGTMGYGLPAAIGAQLAMPGSRVIAIVGDGSVQMNSQELATAVQYKLPVKVVIINNGYLGMIRQWQELFFKQNYSFTNMEAQPDFLKLADAYGAEGYRIAEPSRLIPELTRALTSPNPAIIDVRVAREENVYPMVPAGAPLDEMLLV
jgi:acetolactate synthase-1/2/3 large subunit